VSIEVEGNNNRVAGRDYIENNLRLSDEDLKKLAVILAREIGSFPNDGKQHELSVTVGGDQKGNISLGGTQINIQAVRELTWDDLSPNQLRSQLKHFNSQWWSGWRGYWLNVPVVLMLALSIGLAFSLFQGYLPIDNPQRTWMVMVIVLPIMLILGLLMTKIRRVEARHMADSQATIDAIQAALRRKRR
jgi:hypothetical protein